MVAVVNRCFGIAYRAEVLGEAPEAIRGKEANVSFQSPLARAQKLDDVAAMDRQEQSLVAQAQIVGPQILDTYDWDAAARERSELLGVPAKLVRDETAIKKLRDDRNAALKRQQVEQARQIEQQRVMEIAGKGMNAA
jgi:hypothetical protein